MIETLQPNYKIAFLSRGYRRKSNGFVLAKSDSSVEDLGDEPFQIHQKFPAIQVAVDADRRNGISILENKIVPDVIILDDAFQHRKVTPTFSILLTSYGNLYCDDWYFPTGTLRDSRSESKRAEVIIVTKCPINLDIVQQTSIVEKLVPNPNQKVLFSFLEYDTVLKGGENVCSLDLLNGKNITLVTGIANPKPLLTYLEQKHIVFEHLPFKDHHFFTAAEIEELNNKEYVLTTEKDYVRLKGKVKNLIYISIRHSFFNRGEEFLLELIRKRL